VEASDMLAYHQFFLLFGGVRFSAKEHRYSPFRRVNVFHQKLDAAPAVPKIELRAVADIERHADLEGSASSPL